ncbi:MAG: polymerase, partial [Sphingobacteriales bacterium]
MYLATRIDKSVLLNAVLLFAYFLALVWVNNSYIYQLYGYMGAAERPVDFIQYMYLLLLAIICALLAVGRIERPGDLLVAFFVLVLVPHALVLNGANRFSPEAGPLSGVTLAVVIGVSIIGLANKIRFYSLSNDSQESQGRRVLALLSCLNLAVLAFIVAK